MRSRKVTAAFAGRPTHRYRRSCAAPGPGSQPPWPNPPPQRSTELHNKVLAPDGPASGRATRARRHIARADLRARPWHCHQGLAGNARTGSASSVGRGRAPAAVVMTTLVRRGIDSVRQAGNRPSRTWMNDLRSQHKADSPGSCRVEVSSAWTFHPARFRVCIAPHPRDDRHPSGYPAVGQFGPAPLPVQVDVIEGSVLGLRRRGRRGWTLFMRALPGTLR